MKKALETPHFDVVESDSQFGIMMKKVSVAILPYTVNANGIVDQIGILSEWNLLRDGNTAETLITGTVEDSDADTYETAVRELMEEGGIDMRGDSTDRWTYLGNFYDSKETNKQMPIFAVDVTGKPVQTPSTDGSKKESKSTFKLVAINEAIATSRETLTLAAFLRLFNIMFQASFKNANGETV